MESHKILIVDDEPLVAKATYSVLEAFLSCKILVCTSSETALQVIQRNDIAVLLCDLQMPVYDGTVVMKFAREKDPRTVSVMITGRATHEGLIKAVNDGNILKCIEKPWNPQYLVEVVKEAIEIYEKNVQTQAIQKEPEQKPEQEEKPDASEQRRQIVIRKGQINKGVVPQKKVRQPKYRIVTEPEKKNTVRIKKRRIRLMDKRYKGLSLLKEGGSGSIYKANDTLLGISVAIKVLAESFVKKNARMKILLQEARIAMQLSHKHIVRLHDIHESNGMYYLVMEYIEGKTLREIVCEHGPLSLETGKQIIETCASALGYAHRRKVYHRDLKPDNIMLTDDGILKIIDFGISCLAEDHRDTNIICGTPYYMSPEEISGDPLDHRTDIYSLGIIVHELLTGKLPFEDENSKPDMEDFTPVTSPDLPEPIRCVLDISFSNKSSDRWENVNDFSSAFAQAVAIGQNAQTT
ncbi:protein kinase [Verrucomicrobiota bacterium]